MVTAKLLTKHLNDDQLRRLVKSRLMRGWTHTLGRHAFRRREAELEKELAGMTRPQIFYEYPHHTADLSKE